VAAPGDPKSFYPYDETILFADPMFFIDLKNGCCMTLKLSLK
jgi:hypothetical protein